MAHTCKACHIKFSGFDYWDVYQRVHPTLATLTQNGDVCQNYTVNLRTIGGKTGVMGGLHRS